MSDDGIREAEQVFQESGWQVVGITKQMSGVGIHAVFKCSYAVVSLALVDNVETVVKCWADCQACIARMSIDSSDINEKDLYLVFLVSHIGTSYGFLHRVLNDTYVCRKIVVEKGERSIAEALSDTPFLSYTTKSIDPTDELSSIIDKRVLNDLASRSKETILEHLLSGRYEVEQ